MLKNAPLVFGCANLGALSGQSRRESRELICTAINLGLCRFDTANAYGQGDSERYLREAIFGCEGVSVVTKIGKKTPLFARLIRPFKGIFRQILRIVRSPKSAVKVVRGETLGTTFETLDLQAQLLSSLSRLDGLIVDVLLHNPDLEELESGSGVEILTEAKLSGLVGEIGVSTDSIEVARLALNNKLLDIVQIPYMLFEQLDFDADTEGKTLMLRALLEAGDGSRIEPQGQEFSRRLNYVSNSAVTCQLLFSTSNCEHLSEMVSTTLEFTENQREGS